MKLHEEIQKRRKALGLTQEELANSLGVTPPAVSKWENGVSYPDITLLPALAKQLKTDVNSLLLFKNSISKEEINQFFSELGPLVEQSDWQSYLTLLEEQLREYPHSDFLKLSSAFQLQTNSSIFPSDKQPEIAQRIKQLWQELENSEDASIAKLATQSLFHISLKEKDLSLATAQLDSFTKEEIELGSLDLLLSLNSDDINETYTKTEQSLLKLANMLMVDYSILVRNALKEENLSLAESYISQVIKLSEILEITDIYQLSLKLEVATHKKAKKETIALLKQLFAAFSVPILSPKSLVYQHITNKLDSLKTPKFPVSNLKDYRSNPEFAFIQNEPEFLALLDSYQ